MKKTSLRFKFALVAAKFTSFALKILGRNATNLPGIVAVALCPDFFEYISAPKTVVAVTGTNGKTTVTNMIYDVLTHNCKKVLCNNIGSNTYAGVATVLIAGVSLSNKSDYEYAVLEVDERSSHQIYPFVQPDFLVCTNLFRDSLTRNAHTEFIKEFIDKALPKKTTLILNGDDLICSDIAPQNKRLYYGISRQKDEKKFEPSLSVDLRVCPKCFAPMNYSFIRYHHIGKAKCSKCDFASPEIDYLVLDINKEALQFTLKEPSGATEVYKIPSANIINIYNFLATVAFARAAGFSASSVKSCLDLSVVSTRYSEVNVGGVTVQCQLSKAQNPIACSRAFGYANTLPDKKIVVLMLDEILDADKISENVCWMYDADFEYLRDDSIVKVIAAGPRYLDDKVRLLLAGVDESKITVCKEFADTINYIDTKGVDRVVVLYDLHAVSAANKLKEKLTAQLKGEVSK